MRLAEKCLKLLALDLSFKGKPVKHAAVHRIHSFAAKFPPHLPRLFIEHLTEPGDLVLDPMVGSGTTLVECIFTGRRGVGIDIDPLAVIISRCKVTKVEESKLINALSEVCKTVSSRLIRSSPLFGGDWARKWCEVASWFDRRTASFIEYWFKPKTAVELTYLAEAIREGGFDESVRNVLKLALSAIIVTKSGGLSLAKDLAHSRPHRDLSKGVPEVIPKFKRKVVEVAKALADLPGEGGEVEVLRGDARQLPLNSNSIDLIVTSPPYAVAIDYVRAHKFSLIWLGHPVNQLSKLRREYIGAERALNPVPEIGIPQVDGFIKSLVSRDRVRGSMVARYFADMRSVLAEMCRVLKPGRLAILVVGPSTVRGVSVPTHKLLIETGESIGFRHIGHVVRPLNRDRRYLPVSARSDRKGIEARIHEEYVIALEKR